MNPREIVDRAGLLDLCGQPVGLRDRARILTRASQRHAGFDREAQGTGFRSQRVSVQRQSLLEPRRPLSSTVRKAIRRKLIESVVRNPCRRLR